MKREKGFIAYYVLIMGIGILFILQGMLAHVTFGQKMVREEMEYLHCLYGVERGITYVLAYVNDGGDINTLNSTIYEDSDYFIGILEKTKKENIVEILVTCVSKKLNYSIGKRLFLEYKVIENTVHVQIKNIQLE